MLAQAPTRSNPVTVRTHVVGLGASAGGLEPLTELQGPIAAAAPSAAGQAPARPVVVLIRCVAVSANALPAETERTMQAGADDYIVKPFSIDQVLALVDQQASGRPPGGGRTGDHA